jgi:hypothetical protein
MNKFFNAIKTNDTFTENGMVAHSTSGSSVLDLFYRMGSSRSNPQDIVALFEMAYAEDKNLALKAMFHNRDIRGGQMERDTFRYMFRWLCVNDPGVAVKVLQFVPFYGRWDDVLVALNTRIEANVINMIEDALIAGDALCAKWMPREKSANSNTAKYLMNGLGLTPRRYRKLLANANKAVEVQMCANEWAEINFNHVPSVANMKYSKAFWRHDGERYGDWINNIGKVDAKTGVVNKINAGAIFPHDVLKGYIKGSRSNDVTVDQMWANLPDFLGDGESFIPVIDTSGSMYDWESSRISGDLYAGDVATGLGIYLAERNKSVFKNGMITFSDEPNLVILSGTLEQKVRQVRCASVHGTTDVEAVFRLILDKAKAARLPQEDMPKNIVILSDMQFNDCVDKPSDNALSMITRMYESAGYRIPNVIFWNLASKEGTPTKMNSKGTALVSGYSPSIMTGLLKGDMTPMGVMMGVLLSERYAQVQA